MSDAAAIAAHSAAPSVSPPAMTARVVEDIDLYAEGNRFTALDPSGQAVYDLFGKDGFDFKDFLDIINPLQHLPVVGTLYRAVTGDTLTPGARILGGSLFGGIGGLVTAMVNAVIEDETGSDIGDKVLALFQDKGAPTENIAAASTATPAPEAVAAAPLSAATPAPSQQPPPPAEHKTIPIFAGPPKTLAKSARAASDTQDPTDALIRARATVPVSHRFSVAGLPLEGTVPAARPSHSGTALALAASHPAADAHAAMADAGATGSKDAAGGAPTNPPPDVAAMMRSALDKYEALMKSRTGPSISADF